MNSSATLAVRPDGVGVLTLDQPGSKVNVLTRELWQDIDAALDEAAKQPLKGLVIASGKPGVFIAGADLKLLGDATGPNDPAVRAFIDQGLRVLEKLESLPFPTCAAIDGAALGGGLEVAMACDYRVFGTNPKVQLGLPEVKLGLIPGWGGTQRLPRIVGGAHAALMLMSGDPVSGADAINMELASRSIGDLLVAACSQASSKNHVSDRRKKLWPLSHGDRSAIRVVLQAGWAGTSVAAQVARDVLIQGATYDLYDAIKLETEAFMRLAGSPESKRLIAEFFASRKK